MPYDKSACCSRLQSAHRPPPKLSGGLAHAAKPNRLLSVQTTFGPNLVHASCFDGQQITIAAVIGSLATGAAPSCCYSAVCGCGRRRMNVLGIYTTPLLFGICIIYFRIRMV